MKMDSVAPVGRFARGALLALATLIGAFVGCTPSAADSAPPIPAPAPGPAEAAPTPPVGPQAGKWAGIDIGSRGVKPVVMEFTKTPAGWEFSADTTLESDNTDLGTLADGNQKFDAKRLEATVAAVAKQHKALRGKYSLPPDRVRVVVSSGVFTRFKDGAAAGAARRELVAALEKAVGSAPDFIDDRQEAELAARGTISPANRAGRMLIDIGSGNTKFGWYTAAGFQHLTLDSGSKAFRDAAARQASAKKQPFAEAAAELRESTLAAPLRQKGAKAEGFGKATDVQIIGGAAWAAATFAHPGTGSVARVPLAADDVEKFAELARLKPEEAREKALAGLPDPARAAGAKEVERVQKVFSPEELQAAAEILRAVYAEARLGDKKVVFFQRGQHAWIAGYLMEAAKLPD
jgi:exopolyphosphatase/pppGpp-phosphohydrolase